MLNVFGTFLECSCLGLQYAFLQRSPSVTYIIIKTNKVVKGSLHI